MLQLWSLKNRQCREIEETWPTTFQVFFAFRSAHRKRCNLDGHYAKLPKIDEWLKMRADNISLIGVSFTTFKRNDLRPNDELMIRISLDDREKSKIEKRAVVRGVRERNAGCRFNESGQYDKVLGFYLMP